MLCSFTRKRGVYYSPLFFYDCKTTNFINYINKIVVISSCQIIAKIDFIRIM